MKRFFICCVVIACCGGIALPRQAQSGRTLSGVILDVIDYAIAKRIRRWVDFDLSIDNLTNKRYFETQTFFASRLPGEPPQSVERIHGTPGYPFGVTAGLTFRFFNKH